MKQLIKTIKYIFYRLVSKKMLVTVILGLLLFILFNNKVFCFNVTSNDITYDLPNFDFSVIGTKPYLIFKYGTNNYKICYPKDNATTYTFRNYDNYRVAVILDNTAPSGSSSFTKGSWSVYTSTNGSNWVYSEVINDFVNVYPSPKTYIFSSINIYNYRDNNIYFNKSTLEPYFLETDKQFSVLDFPSIHLFGGSVSNTTTFVFDIGEITSSDTSTNIFTLVLNKESVLYKNNSGHYFYEIPVSLFKYLLVPGKNYNFSVYWSDGTNDYTINRLTIFLGKTTSQETNSELSNANNNLQNIQSQNEQIIQQQQQQIDTQNEIKDLIQDTNIDSNLPSNLPTDNTQDTTTSGVNNIFDFLKNAFTTGTAKDIVIPVPFTQKNFTIQANFLQNILSKTDFAWVSNIINLFWWYMISVFIVKDISSKFTKIKGGDIENIQDNNIKEDML